MYNCGRALGRIGNAYLKKKSPEEAIRYYQKSLSEHRSPEFQLKLKEVSFFYLHQSMTQGDGQAEKLKEKMRLESLYDPAKAEEFRNAGNTLFKESKFAEALKEYSQAIHHDLNDPRAYSNRAACYNKLMALPEALKGFFQKKPKLKS